MKQNLIILAIILTALLLAITSFWNDTVIVDEVPHIGAGYSYLTKGDYRLNPEHPPLAKDLAAIPLLFQKIDKEALFSTKFWKDDINGQWEFGRFLLFKASPDPQKTIRLAKLPVLVFYLLSGILIFFWSKKRYGDIAGYLSFILFLFSPTVIAHARFVTTDLVASFGVLFATYFFINYLKHSSTKNFWLASIFFGIALLAKFSTFLLIPFLGLIALVYGWLHDNHKLEQKIADSIKHGVKALSVFIFGFIIIVWPVYYLHTFNYPPARQYKDTKSNLSSFGNRYLADPVVWASDKPILRAVAQYGLGLLMVTQRSAGGNTIYFRGDVVKKGGPIYFPLVYLIKEPLAWWGLVIIGLIGAVIAQGKKIKVRNQKLGNWIRDNFEEFAMIMWLVIYWTVSIRSSLNIGVRHLLPIYPFVIILVGGQVANVIQNLKRKAQNNRVEFKKLFYIFSFTLYALLGWYIFENLSVYPHYLSYFNQTVGGPSGGHEVVVDSNLDWGQDLKRFSDWVNKNNINKIDFDYFGWADQAWYLKDKLNWTSSNTYANLEDFKLRNPSDGWIAVSASFLMGSRGGNEGNYEWLRQQKPFTVIGNSIFVYRLK